MMAPKDLVKTNDYCAFCIESTEIWKNLEKAVERNISKIEQRTKWDSFKAFFKYEPLHAFRDTTGKQLQVISIRLDMLLTEYYRTQYYSMYSFESIEIHPSLRDSFFSWSHDKLKGQMDIH